MKIARRIRAGVLFGFLCWPLACGQGEVDAPVSRAESTEPPADTLFFGGSILTLEGDEPRYAEALAVRDGRIVHVGDEASARQLVGEATVVRDLGGAALLPGFVDSHSHFIMTAIKLATVNLDPPPAGTVTSIADLQQALRAELENRPRSADEWLFGWGYDAAMLAERRDPTKHDLDVVSDEIPIAIMHFSTHMAVLNSVALDRLGIDARSVAPEGGVIRRVAGSDEPDGVPRGAGDSCR